MQQNFSNPHNTPFKEWQNWFLSTNLWHFSGRKTFHLFWNIIVHRVFVCVVELGLYYTLFYRFTKVLFTGKCMQIIFLIYIHKKNHARIEIYIFLAQIMENEKMQHSQDEKHNFAWWLSLYILYLWSKCNKIREKP